MQEGFPWWSRRAVRFSALIVTTLVGITALALAISASSATLAYAIASGAWAPLGLLLWFKKPEEPLGPVITLVGLTSYSVVPVFLMGAVFDQFPTTIEPIPWVVVIGLALTGGYSYLFVIAIALFPDGRPQTIWNRILLWALISAMVVAAVAGFLAEPNGVAEHPFAPVWLTEVGRTVYDAMTNGFGFALLAAFVLKVVEFRRSHSHRRAQLKWLVYVLVVYLVFTTVAFGVIGTEQFDATGLIIDALFTALIPAAMAIAILRYRLYEIDRLVSRTVTYALLVAIVALLFAVPVVVLPARIGVENNLVIAGTTLAAAALFTPLRKRIQDRVDRRFNRVRYDGVKEIEALAARVNASTTGNLPVDETLGLIERTLQPASMALWVRSADV